MDIRRGVIRKFDSGTYLADVQIVGSMATMLPGVPVAKQIGADLLTSGTKCGVLFFDETNPADACVAILYDGVPAAEYAELSTAETISADWLFSGDKKVQFRDSAIYIHSPSDGVLHLEADGSITFGADLLPDMADTLSLGGVNNEILNLYIGDAGKIYFGLGQDVNLYRDAAGMLKTDDDLTVADLIAATIKPSGAEKLKIYTYARTLDATDIANGYHVFSVTDVGSRLNVRGISCAGWDGSDLYNYTLADSAGVGMKAYMLSTTTCRVDFGTTYVADDVISITIIVAE